MASIDSIKSLSHRSPVCWSVFLCHSGCWAVNLEHGWLLQPDDSDHQKPSCSTKSDCFKPSALCWDDLSLLFSAIRSNAMVFTSWVVIELYQNVSLQHFNPWGEGGRSRGVFVFIKTICSPTEGAGSQGSRFKKKSETLYSVQVIYSYHTLDASNVFKFGPTVVLRWKDLQL